MKYCWYEYSWYIEWLSFFVILDFTIEWQLLEGWENHIHEFEKKWCGVSKLWLFAINEDWWAQIEHLSLSISFYIHTPH